jgi:hypothetical protein
MMTPLSGPGHRWLLLSFLCLTLPVPGLHAQEPEPPPDQWPYLLPCANSTDPRACSDSLIRTVLAAKLDPALPGGGLVVIAFTISPEGHMEDIRLLRDPNGIGDELVRILGLLPDWQAGLRVGQAVPVTLQLPLRIRDPEGLDGQYRLVWGDEALRHLSRRQLRVLSSEPLLIRDPEGRLHEPALVDWTCRRGDKVRSHRGPAREDPRLARWLRRCPPGASLEAEAFLSRDTRFVPVRRQWILTK